MNIMEVARDLYLVPIPIPVPLRYVNCYVARGSDGWTIVDTGFHDAAAEAAWRAVFGQLGFGPEHIERIIVTHHHPDHYGAAGWLQQLSGAPVLMLDRDAALADILWDPTRLSYQDLAQYFRRTGVPEVHAQEIERYQAKVQGFVMPRPKITTVREGDRVRVGNRLFEAIWAPGHADGLMVLWNEEERLFLANDMVLIKITPNISLWPFSHPDPLGNFLESLSRVARIPAALTLTGHRQPVTDLERRCTELAHHHDERLRVVRDLAGEGATPWEVSLGLFGMQDSVHNLRFAVLETLSHLEYLARREILVREEGEVVRYRRPPRRAVSGLPAR